MAHRSTSGEGWCKKQDLTIRLSPLSLNGFKDNPKQEFYVFLAHATSQLKRMISQGNNPDYGTS